MIFLAFVSRSGSYDPECTARTASDTKTGSCLLHRNAVIRKYRYFNTSQSKHARENINIFSFPVKFLMPILKKIRSKTACKYCTKCSLQQKNLISFCAEIFGWAPLYII